MANDPMQDDRSGARAGTAETPRQDRMAAPSINLPKGGAALRGINETFSVNAVTGSATISVPIPTSASRAGFGPQLSLSYDSGSGNGAFGLGWSLGLGAITRRTDRGIPRYVDAIESDIFVLAGADDLVPVFRHDNTGAPILDGSGKPVVDDVQRDGYVIR